MPTIQRSFCRFCVAGCGVLVHVEGDEVVAVRGDHEHPLSHGYLCPKGRALGAAHHDPRRLDACAIGRGADRVAVGPVDLVDDLARRLACISEEWGPDAVGVYIGTGGFFDRAGSTASFGLLAGLGTRSFYTPFTIDSVAKPAVTQLMSGNSLLFPHIDIEATRLTILVGCNPVVSHGHLWALPDPVTTLRDLAARGEVWVVDPRRTETAQLATRHVAPRQGSDHALFAHLVRELLEDGADQEYLRAHTVGVDRLRAAVAPYTAATAAELTGVDTGTIADLVAAVRRAGRLAVLTGTGSLFPASAPVTEWLVWATLLVTGSLDRPGGMWCNTDFFARAVAVPFVAAPRAPAPGPPSRPELPGWMGQYPIAAMADEIDAGNLRALVVVGGNPLVSFPDHDRIVSALCSLEVLAVADVVESDTTQIATHVMACAGQLERADLNLASTQHSLYGQHTPAVLPVGPGRRPLWWFAGRLGRQMGFDAVPGDPDELSDDDVIAASCPSPVTALDELRDLPLGVVAERPFGWLTARSADDPWDLAPAAVVERMGGLPDPPELALLPRRQLRHLNSMLRDVPAPGGRVDEAAIFLHPHDAHAAGLADGDLARLSTEHGSVEGVVRIDGTMAPGTVAVPHGYRHLNVAALTSARPGAVEPLSGMVLQAGLAVTVVPAGVPA